MAKKNNKPVDEIPRGRMKLLQWENKKDGETFPSFSITKTDTKFDEEDKTKFLGKIFSLDLLTSKDIDDLEEAIKELKKKREESG